jgi:alpha-galactosidase
VAQGSRPGEKYVAVFNLGDEAENVQIPWGGLGIAARSAEVRDLWSHSSLGKMNKVDARIAPHASVLYKISF